MSSNDGDIEDNEGGQRMREPPTWMRDYVSGEGLGYLKMKVIWH